MALPSTSRPRALFAPAKADRVPLRPFNFPRLRMGYCGNGSRHCELLKGCRFGVGSRRGPEVRGFEPTKMFWCERGTHSPRQAAPWGSVFLLEINQRPKSTTGPFLRAWKSTVDKCALIPSFGNGPVGILIEGSRMSGVQMNRRKVSAGPVKKMIIKPFKGGLCPLPS